jgi:Icc protein
MLKILQISDLHILSEPSATLLGINTDYYFQQVLAAAHSQHGPFDLLLLTGDLAQETSVASYERILSTLQSYPTPCLCLPGNHDDEVLMQSILNTPQVSSDRQMQFGNWQIICLNSRQPGTPVGYLAKAELQFLEQRLTAQPDAPTMLALHHHCISSGSPWMDTMQLQNSPELLAIVDKHPQLKIVTFGHVHQVITSRYRHVAVFSAPATCFQFQPFATEMAVTEESPGYRLFELAADGGYTTDCYRLSEPLLGLDHNSHSY